MFYVEIQQLVDADKVLTNIWLTGILSRDGSLQQPLPAADPGPTGRYCVSVSELFVCACVCVCV